MMSFTANFLLLLLVLPTMAPAETSATLPSPVVELSEPVDGKSLAEYANQWWQWAAAMPPPQSAVRYETGAFCAEGQSGPVWFLAGGYGTSRIDRNCTIPANRHLFFPVINIMQMYSPAYGSDCAQAMAMVARENDTFVYLKVIFDGLPIDHPEHYRIASQTCFDPYERVADDPQSPKGILAATDGYWIMLRPLSPGRHRLEFRAFYSNPDEALGDMVQNITYDLDVLAD